MMLDSFGSRNISAYKIFKIDSTGKASILAEISDAPAAYLHTVFLTQRFFGEYPCFRSSSQSQFVSYLVLAVWQCDYKYGGLPVMINGALSVNTFSPWSPERKTLFFVVDRKKGGVVGRSVGLYCKPQCRVINTVLHYRSHRYQTEAFFAFHSLNSYDDEDGSVVLDISCYKDNSVR